MHLLFLGLLAVIVFGPQRLPEIGRSIGKSMREFKDSVGGVDLQERFAASTRCARPPARRISRAPSSPASGTCRRPSHRRRASPIRLPPKRPAPPQAGAGRISAYREKYRLLNFDLRSSVLLRRTEELALNRQLCSRRRSPPRQPPGRVSTSARTGPATRSPAWARRPTRQSRR